MEADADIAEERRALAGERLAPRAPGARREGAMLAGPVPLVVERGSMQATALSAELVAQIGGLPVLKRFTALFYQRCFVDPHISIFIREHKDFHGERFATWIAEKMGAGTPWTEERRTRPQCPFLAHGHKIPSAHDRSSAHFAAWHSPKRDPEDWGMHFQLNDCRVWMRLHFWAAREAGAFEDPAFEDYYVRLIGHFVSVYEKTAPPFARESARWSMDPENIQRYMDADKQMHGVHGISLSDALAQLPAEERTYTGSKGRPLLWPYELMRSPAR